MRRALLHRVHERSPAFNDATYAEIKYSTARTPGRTARPGDPELGSRWIVATQAFAIPLQSVEISMKIQVTIFPAIEFFQSS